eukprot:SAG31_NODE_868_length_11355_cov_4.658582_10_plen_292_part_00
MHIADGATLGFHQDAGRVNSEMEPLGPKQLQPRLSVKAAFYLNDVSLENAPTWVVPGSHLLSAEAWDARLPSDGQGQPTGAIPILAHAGSALIFDRRLRHAAAANRSDYTRRALFIGYAYRWLKSQSGWTAAALQHIGPDGCAITRQLLNDNFSAQGWFSPTAADVPLYAWLVANGIDPKEAGLEGQGHNASAMLQEQAHPRQTSNIKTEITSQCDSSPKISYGDSDKDFNFGRLQGDVGREAWGMWPGLAGGAVKDGWMLKEDLERLSKSKLVELVLRVQGVDVRRFNKN